MGLDLSMTAVPIQMKNIFHKANEKSDSEYPSIIFSIPRVFQADFNDFGHPEWVEFKKDAHALCAYYPDRKFDYKYYFNSNRTHDVLRYLISKLLNDINYSFFADGIAYNGSIGTQGSSLKYWDEEILKEKAKLLESIVYDDLMKHYDFEKMVDLGIYKITQINSHQESIKSSFINLKRFMVQATALNGYVLILND